MPDNEMDPAASTQMFRQFVAEEPASAPGEPPQRRSSPPVALIAGVVAVIIVIAVAVLLAM